MHRTFREGAHSACRRSRPQLGRLGAEKTNVGSLQDFRFVRNAFKRIVEPGRDRSS
jgi:hypothetical protein